MTRILLTIVLFALLPLSTASAQSPRFDRIPFERRNDVARVEITVNLFVAGPERHQRGRREAAGRGAPHDL